MQPKRRRNRPLAKVSEAEADLAAAQHRLQQDQALAARAERDRVRYQALVEKHEISRSDYDARETRSCRGRAGGGGGSGGHPIEPAEYRRSAQPGGAAGGADRRRAHRSAADYRRAGPNRNRPRDTWSRPRRICTPRNSISATRRSTRR